MPNVNSTTSSFSQSRKLFLRSLRPLGPNLTVAGALQSQKLYIAAIVLASIALFWPTLSMLVNDIMDNPDHSHCLLVPLISAAILYANRKKLGALPARRSATGLVILTIALAIYIFGYRSFTNVIQRIGMWGFAVGAVWYLFGPRMIRSAMFPIVFLLFTFPVPLFILLPLKLELQSIVATASADLTILAGVPANPVGNVIEIEGRRLEVADACSGVRSMMAIVTTAALFGYLFRTGIWRAGFLIACAIPVTVLVNVVRVTAIALGLVYLDFDMTSGVRHDTLSLLVFGMSLAALYGSWKLLEWFLPRRKEEEGQEA